jgi:hypothetical protein
MSKKTIGFYLFVASTATVTAYAAYTNSISPHVWSDYLLAAAALGLVAALFLLWGSVS